MNLSACRPKVSRLKICLDTFKKHKNIDTLIPLKEKTWFRLQYIFLFKNYIFPKYYDSSKIFVIFRRLFLFLSQICSHPIQIYSRWIQISQRQQRSKHPYSYTDKDRHKNTFSQVMFFKYLCLPMDGVSYDNGKCHHLVTSFKCRH